MWHTLYWREDTAEHHKEDEQEKDDEHGLQLVGCHAGDKKSQSQHHKQIHGGEAKHQQQTSLYVNAK